MRTAAFVAVVLLAPIGASAKTWVVDQKNEPGADFVAIGPAIGAAANGDTIEVKPGVYEEALSLDKKILKLVAVEGPEKTSLSGPPTLLTIASPGAAGTLLQGFRLTGAAAGAVRITNAIVTFDGNVFEGNGTTEQPIQGGAIWAAAGSQITVKGGSFTANHAADGGAVYVEGGKLLVDGARFVDNGAGRGGAIFASTSAVDVARSFFCGDAAGEVGGALAVEQGTLSLVASLFVDGTAAVGGGIWLSAVAGEGGGGAALDNLGIVGGSGGGLWVGEGTSLALRNTVVAGVDGGGLVLAGGTADVTYSAFWGNGPANVVDGDGAALADPDGKGVLLDQDPLLAEATSEACAAGSHEPKPGSPLVDAGDPTMKDSDKTRSDIGPYGGPGGVEPVLDTDGDTVPDLRDNCPGDSNVDQADTDEDGEGDVCDATSGVTDDKDKDGIKDIVDNCPVYNPEQVDTDKDGYGDVCDANDDDDPVPDIGDCKPLDSAVYPGNQEVCNGLDDDCDDLIDEDLSCQAVEPDAGGGGTGGEVDASGAGEPDGAAVGGSVSLTDDGGEDGGCATGGPGARAAGVLGLLALAGAALRILAARRRV